MSLSTSYAPFGAGREEVRAKDLKEGVLYRSRFGFLVRKSGTTISREWPSGEWGPIHPAADSIFYVVKVSP